MPSVFFPTGFHLYAGLLVGLTAAFCEEILFRGFMMTEFARMGYGKLVQIVVPGLFFGLMHLAFIETTHSVVAKLGVMVPTAVLGMLWGVAYLLGPRALMPSIVAHFLNDFTGVPWILFLMTSHSLHR